MEESFKEVLEDAYELLLDSEHYETEEDVRERVTSAKMILDEALYMLDYDEGESEEDSR